MANSGDGLNGLGELDDLGFLGDGEPVDFGKDGFALEPDDIDPGAMDRLDDGPEMAPEEPSPEEAASLGLKQTDFGAHPWGAGAGYGYRPHAMARTDQTLRGAAEETMQAAAVSPGDEDTVDPSAVYDRSSYERGKTYGAGIFDMEETTTYRAGYGSFEHDYALPDYMAREDELSVLESEMFDVNTGTWRVVQPSAGGVQLMKRGGKAYSPFNRPGQTSPMSVVPGAPRPRPAVVPESFMEAFARDLSSSVMDCAARQHPAKREAYVNSVVRRMGIGKDYVARKQARNLIRQGYPPDRAMEDTICVLVIHALYQDLDGKHRQRDKGPGLPRVDQVAAASGPAKPSIVKSAVKNLAKLVQSPRAFQEDTNRLMQSHAGQALSGLLGQASSDNGIWKTLLIGGGVALAGWLAYEHWYKEAR